MFNTITKLYNMLGEIIGIHTIKKKKCTKIYDGYTADDEKSDDSGGDITTGRGGRGGDDITTVRGGGDGGRDGDGGRGDGGRGSDGGRGDGGRGEGYDDNTIMVDGLEQILLKVLKL